MSTRQKRRIDRATATNAGNPYELQWGKRNGSFVCALLTIGSRQIQKSFAITQGAISKASLIRWLEDNEVNRKHLQILAEELLKKKIP